MTKLSTSIMMPFMAAMILFCTVEAFSPAATQMTSSLARFSSTSAARAPGAFQLRASEEEEVGLPPLPSQRDATAVKDEPKLVEPVAAAPVAASKEVVPVEENEGTSYPINLPSPVLLATSMVLAIASTGSLFELAGGGSTKLGFGPTAALAAIGLPMSIFLIYAAILKGAAETEEDDKEYNKPRRL